MVEYIQEFEILMVHSETVETLEQSITRFIAGLQYDIADIVKL